MAKRVVLALLLVALFITPTLFAQTVTGTINGTVTDKSGGALPGATVTIRNMDTGLERVVNTNEKGYFNAPFLPVGKYKVTAELEGLGKMSRQNVGVQLNTTTVQNFTLAQTVTETITVSADAPHVDVTDGEVKQTMRSEQIMSLPQGNQASFLGLASTFSGYQENPTSGQNNPTLSSGSSINFNGTGTRGATFQINGVNNDDSSENQNRQGVSLAAIKSFQVLTNSFSSEFGRGYGAVVLVQTKSGTNDIDGEIYSYAQKGQWNSLDYFAAPGAAKPDNHRYQGGVTLGFPIMRDTLFGFATADAVNYKGDLANTRGVFTAADLALPRLTLGNDTPANRAWQDSMLARWPQGATPNNPAVNARAYTAYVQQDWPDRDYSGRLDWNVGQKNNATAHYQRSNQKRQTGELIVGESALQNNRQSNLGLTWTGILSNDIVQEARYGLGLRSTNVNIMAGNDTPIVRLNGLGLTFTILGNAGAYPINRNQRDNQLVYNIQSSHWAKHTVKAGFDLRNSQLNDVADNYTRGYWIFNASCAGVSYPTSIHAFMAGCAAGYQEGYGPRDLRNNIKEQNFYVQDDWRPTDNLTVNIGIRDERAGAPTEDNGLIDYMYKTKNYVDPRLGFAYAPNWDSNKFLRGLTGGYGNFSIRGGFGIYHGRVFQSIFSQGGANVRFNPPNAMYMNLSGVFSSTNPQFSNFNLADPTNGFVFVPGTASTLSAQSTFIDPNLRMPETHQWNLTFERSLFNVGRLRLSYVGTLGRDLLQYDYGNLPVRPDDPASLYKVAADYACAGTGTTVNGVLITKTAACPNTVPIADNEISYRVTRTADRRPNKNYGTWLTVSNRAKSWYHAGQAEYETGVTHGFSGRMTYTFSKAIDTGSEATSVGTGDINIFPPGAPYEAAIRGLSRMDTRHRFTLAGSYAIPGFQNSANTFARLALSGWTLSAVGRIASGTPFTIVDTGTTDWDFDGVNFQRPVLVDPAYGGGWHINDPNTSKSRMPAGAFRHPVYGDNPSMLVGRNTYFTSGQRNLDLGVYKTFGLPRGTALMFRFDAFNVFDHAVFGFPSNDIVATNFGVLNTTNYTPRTLQLGFRLMY